MGIVYENKETFSKNLQKYMKAKGVDRNKLCDDLGFKYMTVSDWINKKTYPRIDKIEILANYFGIEKSDLIEDKVNLEEIPGIMITKNLINVPILGSVICGQPTMMEENFTGYFKLDPDIAKPDFSLRAEGDSMIDANIHEGDLVFFRKTPDVENGSIACVLLDDQVTLKRIIKADDTLILQPANTSYSPIVVRDGDYTNVQILGEMIGVYSTRSK